MPRRRRSYGGFREYVPVAVRRQRAERAAAAAARKGAGWQPVCGEGRRIAATHWGRAWCRHIESFHDFSNRLPRGRTYVRNGSVVDLRIEKGAIHARVAGSEIYRQKIAIRPCGRDVWKGIVARCSGHVGSLVELLAGRISDSVMEKMSCDDDGLFPDLRDVSLSCTCLDWASLCKHLAAVLYGVGVRLDDDPGLLFTLRGVDPADLIDVDPLAARPSAAAVPTVDGDLAAVFDIDLAEDVVPRPSKAKKKTNGGKSTTRKTKKAAPRSSKRAGARARRAPRAKSRVTRQELIASGVPPGTVSTWLNQGVLRATGERGIYRHTRASRARLADYSPSP